MPNNISLQPVPSEAGVVELGRLLRVPLGKIRRFPDNPRRNFPRREMEAFAKDIQRRRQKNPLRVCPDPDVEGDFLLIAGERRTHAFEIIREWTGIEPDVKVLVETVGSWQEHFEEALFDNLQRKDLDPLEEAAAYHRLHYEGDKLRVPVIAERASKSKSHVEHYIRMHTLPDGVKKLMDADREKDDQLSVGAAIDIAWNIKGAGEQLTAAREIVARGLDTAERRTYISVRAGKAVAGFGGQVRRGGDEYRMFSDSLERMVLDTQRFSSSLDVPRLYRGRSTGSADRAQHASRIDSITNFLQTLKLKITRI